MLRLDPEFEILGSKLYAILTVDNAIAIRDGYDTVIAYTDTKTLHFSDDYISYKLKGLLTYHPDFQEFVKKNLTFGKTTIRIELPLSDGLVKTKYNIDVTTKASTLVKALNEFSIECRPLKPDENVSFTFHKVEGRKAHELVKMLRNVNDEVEALTVVLKAFKNRILRILRNDHLTGTVKTKNTIYVNTPHVKATIDTRKNIVRLPLHSTTVTKEALELLPSIKNLLDKALA